MQHTIYWGDARAMSDIDDSSVHLVVTSPPYWQLKDYGVAGQIGFHDSLEEYNAKLNQVWAECFRVLHDGCRLCINIGDQFARAAHYGRYKVIPLHSQIIEGCEALGFDYMGAIIWQKTTTMNASGGGAVMGSFPRPRNGIVKLDYEFILLFKKLGASPKATPEQKQQSTLTPAEWNQFFSGHWNFPGEKQGDGHLAIFPTELPRRLIRMFSFPGETVLDPFAGSGTTLRAARELGRCGIGYEINRDFESAMRRRLGCSNDVDFRDSRGSVQHIQSTLNGGIHHPQRQVDSRAMRFNSIIELADFGQPRDKAVRVREIVAPDCVRLQDGVQVLLLGVRPLAAQHDAALQFLRDKVLNRAVFLRFDKNIEGESTSQNDARRAYLYLSNKTFINAKMLRLGLVEVDLQAQHRYAAHFQNCANKN